MGEGEGFVGPFVCGINIVQDIVSPCRKGDVSMELWKHAFGVGVVEIPSQDEEGIWVGCLLLTDVLVEFIQCLTPVVGGARRDVNWASWIAQSGTPSFSHVSTNTRTQQSLTLLEVVRRSLIYIYIYIYGLYI